MYLPTIFLAASLASLATAAPPKSKSYFETFEELKVPPGTSDLNTPPTPHKGLDYHGVGLQTNELNAVGFTPKSGHNTAFYSPLTDTTLGGNPFIKVARKGDYMSLESFYFLCATNVGAAIIPVDCTTIVSATDENGVARSITLKYIVNGKKMQKAEFPKHFRKIKSFGLVSTTGDTVNDATLTTSIDNMRYTIYQP